LKCGAEGRMRRGPRTTTKRVRLRTLRWRKAYVSVSSVARRTGVRLRRASRVWRTCPFILSTRFLPFSTLLCTQALSSRLARVQFLDGSDSVLAQLRPQHLPCNHAPLNPSTRAPPLFIRETWTVAVTWTQTPLLRRRSVRERESITISRRVL
jgi:hypothetical protein